MIAPSPDWFVGLSRVNLRAGGHWGQVFTFGVSFRRRNVGGVDFSRKVAGPLKSCCLTLNSVVPILAYSELRKLQLPLNQRWTRRFPPLPFRRRVGDWEFMDC